jgi:carbamoyl-phosphate synthase small subunit
MLRQLQGLGLNVRLFAYNSKPSEILAVKPHGLIVSNGPEEDPGLAIVVDNLKGLIGKLPIMGIAAGHQVLCRALGAKVSKMKLGHRGANYPVHSSGSQKGDITVQNHGLVVDAASLNKIKTIKITGYNLNDRTVEEIESKALRLLGVQYEPVCPGFDEINPAFYKFMKFLERSN